MNSNILNFFNNLEFRIYDKNYYDFYLDSNEVDIYINDNTNLNDLSIVNIDFNNNLTISGNNIYSLNTWEGFVNSGVTANTFGLTGIDNGQIIYNQSGDPTNQELVHILTGSTLNIISGDGRLFLTKVSGSTNQFIYPTNFINDSLYGNVLNLCGGFYQGYYKLYGFDYQTIPEHVNKAILYSFKIKPTQTGCTNSGVTLNDLYPNNKGIFFYLGTRAENKFWNNFNGLNSGCTSGCTSAVTCTDTLTTLCTIPKENEISINVSGITIPLHPNNLNNIITTDNKFLIFGKNKHGTLGTATTSTYSGESITFTPKVNDFNKDINPFLLFTKNYICETHNSNCGCVNSGNTVNSLNSFEKNPNKDIDLNSFAFLIKDDGSIGYRYLYYDCNSGITSIKEGYSVSGLVNNEEWNDITIRWIANDYIENLNCYIKRPRYGKLMFYVNCFLKYVVNDFPEISPYNLDEIAEKQITVPYNISIGGGTQGLLESMTFDGQDPNDLGLLIEKNFSGSFIGQIASFKVFIEDIGWCGIKNLCD